MVDKSDALLQARVIARNRAGEVANQLYPKLIDIFKEYIGKKVVKANGGLLQKICNKLPDFPRELVRNPTTVVFTETYWREYSRNEILFKVNVSSVNVSAVNVLAYDNSSKVCNEEVSIYICGLFDGFITHWGGPPNFRTDYNLDEVKSLREEWRVAKQKADDAEKACWPFGVQ